MVEQKNLPEVQLSSWTLHENTEIDEMEIKNSFKFRS